MTMQVAEWVTRCDRCGGQVRVSVPPAERVRMKLYCEGCFEDSPDEPIVPQGPIEPLPQQAASTQPMIQAATPLAVATTPMTLEEARRMVAAADGVSSGEPVYVTCENCAGTGRVRLEIGR